MKPFEAIPKIPFRISFLARLPSVSAIFEVTSSDYGGFIYDVRSSVLGGQVVAEIRNWGSEWGWSRGYVYWPSGELLAVQQGGVRWVHRDPVVKSQRLTDEAGNVTAVIELDPWGGETDRCVNQRQQPYRYTTYERDGDGVDQALMRSYHGWWARFNEPDPWEGSYDLTDPQSFNRYAYVQNDPVNYVDPTGLISDEEEVIRIEARAPRWVDDFWLRHALGVLFGAGQRVRLWTEYEPRTGSRDDTPVLVPMQSSPSAKQGPDPREVERIKNTCLEIIQAALKNGRTAIFQVIRQNKRDSQPFQLSLAHAAVESSLDPEAIGLQGELGLFQLFLSTAKEVAKRIGIENITKKLLLTDPGLNTQIATSYLQQLVDAFNGDVRTALGAYKQGRRSVLQVGLSKSSQEYADGVLACAEELQSRGIR